MKFGSNKKRTTVEKMVYGVFAVVGVIILLQICAAVWIGTEVVTSVQESGGVKEALIDLAKDAKEISDVFTEQ